MCLLSLLLNVSNENRDISNNGSVVWKFLKRTINITDYRNGEDNESSEIWNVWWDLSWLVC
jgi:hypothetical protein